jgi:hypothetical protein
VTRAEMMKTYANRAQASPVIISGNEEQSPLYQNATNAAESKKGSTWLVLGIIGGLGFIIYGIPFLQKKHKEDVKEQRLLKTLEAQENI